MKAWRHAAAAIACLAAISSAATPAFADTYPSKPITIIVPAAPGGVTDMLGRILAQHFITDWGAQVVVENKPGANNQIAAEYVTHQPGDGYTLFIGPETTFIVNPTLYSKLPYDPVNGFTPITGLISIYHGLILNPSVPADSVKELIALDKEKPGQLNYGTFGVGSSGHLNMEMFNTMAGTHFVPVHYKGAAPAMQDVIAGHIQLMFVSVGNAVPQSKGGAVKFIAVGAPKRMALLPDVPAVAETVPGFTAVSWFALFGPAGMPADVTAKINGEVRKIFADPEVQKNFLDAQYFQSIVGTPAELTERINTEEPKWRKLLETAHIHLD
ncbi:MAG TPA: tripartite tricarboxylate transporter substrate binding protein [Xanthobacteraceae bacterium]|jgi:tripartite-type tricarboxylate transporter receptor subunit TctC|nr:tripartite tricarboxylate transporter substrate binding protein [Xanthobacteraceae bacterium]